MITLFFNSYKDSFEYFMIILKIVRYANRCSVQVKETQRAIKQALTERYYSWREAEELAKQDKDINLSGEGPAYVPNNFVEEPQPEPEQTSEKAEAKPNA